MFVQGAAQNRVKQICNGCPVKMECLADALDNRIEFGVWGGMTERERRALLRKRPHVKSWTDLLQNAATRQIPAQADIRRPAYALRTHEGPLPSREAALRRTWSQADLVADTSSWILILSLTSTPPP